MKSRTSTWNTATEGGRVVIVGLWLAFSLTICMPAGGANPDKATGPMSIDQHHQVLGELAPGEQRTVVFNVVNTSQNEISILDLATGDEGMLLHSDDCRLVPGASGEITAMVTAGLEVGPWWVRGKVIVRVQEPDGGSTDAVHPLAVSGFVNSAYDPVTPIVDMGIIDPKTGGTFEFHLSSREVPALEIRQIEIPEGLSVVEVALPDDPQAVSLKIRVEPGMQQGRLEKQIVVHSNVSRQPIVRVQCEGFVYGEIEPNPLPVRFRRSDGYILGTFELRSRTPRSMSVSGLKSSPSGMILLGQEPCAQAPKQCVEITVSPRKMRPLAAEGTIDVVLQEGSEIRIPFVMKTFAPQGLRRLIPFLRQNAPQVLGGGEKQGDGPRLRWAVDGDAGVFGYLIYRSSQEAGPFVRLKNQMIVARGTDPGQKALYQFVDDEVANGVGYFYYVESVLVDGTRKQLTERVKIPRTDVELGEKPEG